MAGTIAVVKDDAIRAGTGIRRIKWTWVCAGGVMTETTPTVTITGKLLGVRAKETSIGEAYNAFVYDAAGHDVLQGLCQSAGGGLSADATADTNYRVPVDDTSGGFIWLFDEPVYLQITSAGATDSGVFELYVDLP